MGNNKTRWVGLAGAALLLSSMVGFESSSAGATVAADPTDFVATVPAGSLALQERTDASGIVSGKVIQYDTATPPAVIDTQTFSITRCAVTTDNHLLKFVSSSGTVGIYNNGLGTKLKNTCSPAEGRTSAGEFFTVSLGTKFDSTYHIDSSELDIEGKFGASLQWTALDGVTSIPGGAAPLASSNDNGPDAGTGDNNIVKIGTKGDKSDNYTSLTLTTPTGEFGLDGGGDGVYPVQNSLGNNDSIFYLVTSSTYDYTVGCKTAVSVLQGSPELSQADSSGNDSTVSELTYLRLANKNQADCAPIGVTVTASDSTNPDQVFFDNSTISAAGVTQNVRARVKIVWIVQTAGKTQAQVDTEMAREVVFIEGGAKVPVANCTSVPVDVFDAVDNPDNGPLDPNSTAYIPYPAGFPWCLMSDTRVVTGSTIVQTQYYSGYGDPRIF